MRNILKTMKLWPALLCALTLVGAGVYFLLERWTDNKSWIAVAAAAGLVLILTLIWYLTIKNRLLESVVAVGLENDKQLEARMDGLAYPYAVIGSSGEILWTNSSFRDIVWEHASVAVQKSSRIDEIFPSLDIWAEEDGELEPGDAGSKDAAPDSRYVSLGDRVFQYSLTRLDGELPLMSLFLSDETEHLETLVELEDQRNVVGLVYIDNYEELLKKTDSESQGLLNAVIEQRIYKYFRRFGGLVCKTERDHFHISVDAKGLRAMKQDRFHLLEEAKKIQEGNSVQVTLSITFGQDGDSYEDNLAQARNAMDLALARGGDQAVVKTPDNVEYFGGKTLGEAAFTRVKARVKAQALRELMAPRDEVFIMGHAMGDNDSFGASVAVYRAAVSLHKRAHIVLNSLSFSVRPLWERFETSADYPRELFLTGDEALARIGSNALVVVVDTNRAAMTECPALLEKSSHVVVFDHHRQAAEAIPAVLSYVEPYASSASEMTAELLQYFGEENLKPKPLEAEAIYSGIVVDTNNFADRTSARTFEAAAYLKRSGADLVKVKKLLREDFPEYKAKAEALRQAEIFMDHFAFSECDAEGLDSPTIVGAQAANELLNISTVKASFVLTRYNETVYVSARSIDEVNVQLVMERLGGGGHLSVAGAQFRDKTIEEVRNMIQETIKQMLEEGAI